MAKSLLIRYTGHRPPPLSSPSSSPSSSSASSAMLPKMSLLLSLVLLLSLLSIETAECVLLCRNLERHSTSQENEDDNGSGSSGVKIHLNLMAVMPFTSRGGTVPVPYFRDTASRRRVEGNLGFSHMAAALLAMRHFNSRNPRVVPELSFLQECHYYFDIANSTMTDSQGRKEAALGAILDYAYQQEQQQQQSQNQDGYYYNCPDAIVDGYYFQEAPTLQLGTIANSLQLPFVSSGGFDLNLIASTTRTSTSASTSSSTTTTTTTTKSTTTPANRLIPQQSSRVYADVFALAEAVIQYLQYIGRADYVGLLHSINPTSVQIHEAIQTLSASVATTMTTDRNDTTTTTATTNTDMRIPHLYSMDYVPESFYGIQRSVMSTLQTFLKTGYRTIVAILDDYRTELPLIAKAAKDLNMVRTDYVWILTGNFDVEYFLFWIEMVSDADIAELLLGVAAIQPLEGFIYHQHQKEKNTTQDQQQRSGATTTTKTTNEDRFYQAWSDQGQEFIDLVHSKNPIRNVNQVGYFQAPDDSYFQTMGPGVGSGFMYDAVIATGLGFCAAAAAHARAAAQQLSTETSTNNTSSSSSWTTVTQGIQASSFEGATGWVSFDATGMLPGRRVGHSVSFAAYNIRLPTSEDLNDL
jgi:hypothetical protein